MEEGRLRCLIGLILLSLCVAAAVGSRELPAHHIIAIVPVGINPWGVGVNPNINRVYVANSDSDNVSFLKDSGE